ncbi:DUF4386 domain-containing protein [Hyphococcus luteus]|uniref:DUF4386 domain-containing protein n=1 Tax=Hyphococcus luteus TaxID=2058213 RepID=A0A2S7K6S8_9PROT|nr:DUF4386 domain-containing protein [Marinicaulis flavus]PQA88220.1 DUF4386 domain-containing protein [Marinicaulis flavus]
MMSAGRQAGLLYLLLGVTGAFSTLYVPGQLFVADDPQATLERISASPLLLKLGIASGLFSDVMFMGMAVRLFLMLERYGRFAAGLLVVFVVVGVALHFSAFTNLYAVAPLAEGAEAASGDMAARVMERIEQYELEMGFVEIFWGLWLIPFGYLVLVSGAIPRVIGFFLVLGGAGYLMNFLGPLLLPDIYVGTTLSVVVAMASVIGEMGAIFWLLIMGARNERY